MLSNLSTFINNAKTNSVESFKDAKVEMQTAQNNFDTLLTVPLYAYYNNRINVTGPTTKIYNYVISEYGLYYDPVTQIGTILYNFKNECTLLINEIIESLIEASNNIDSAFNTNDLSNELQEASEKITDMKEF